MHDVVDRRYARRERRSADASGSAVSVLRWPSGRSSGVFEMFGARETGWFGSLESAPPDPERGENVLLVSASRTATPDGPAVLLSLVNTSPGQAVKLSLRLAGPTPRSVTGTILTTPAGDGEALARSGESTPPQPAMFCAAVLRGKTVDVTVPARSVVVLTVRQRRLVALRSRPVGAIGTASS
jgi:hypothetical protein